MRPNKPVPAALQSKIVMVREGLGEDIAGTIYENGWFTGKFRDFGDFLQASFVEMNRRTGGDVSLNTLVHADDAGEVQDWLVDPASSPEAVYAEQEEAKQRRQALAGALEVLNPRERSIFEARFLSEPSIRLEDLATRYGVSRERVRQIENRAFEKVRAAVCACPTRDRHPEQRDQMRGQAVLRRAAANRQPKT